MTLLARILIIVIAPALLLSAPLLAQAGDADAAPDDLTVTDDEPEPAAPSSVDDDLDQDGADEPDGANDAPSETTPPVDDAPERQTGEPGSTFSGDDRADVVPEAEDEAVGINWGAGIGGGVGCALAGGVTALVAGAALGYSGILLAQLFRDPNGGCLDNPAFTFFAVWFLGMCGGGASTVLHGFGTTLATGVGGAIGSGVAGRDTGWMWLGTALGVIPAALGTLGVLATNFLLLGLLFRGESVWVPGVDNRFVFVGLLGNMACASLVALLSGPIAVTGAAFAERWFSSPDDEPEPKRKRSRRKRRRSEAPHPSNMRF